MAQHVVEILASDTSIAVRTPYEPAWVALAKKNGGKWHHELKYWVFETSDEEFVRTLLWQVFHPAEEREWHIEYPWR